MAPPLLFSRKLLCEPAIEQGREALSVNASGDGGILDAQLLEDRLVQHPPRHLEVVWTRIVPGRRLAMYVRIKPTTRRREK